MKYAIITIVLLALFQPVVHLKTPSQSSNEKRFAILIASYNNKSYYKKNLKSVYEQDYPSEKCRIVYLDDQSTDNTYEVVKKYVAQYGQKFHTDVRSNPVRMGAMLSRYRAAHECDDDEIIIYLDGDDFFPPNPNILSYLNSLYQKSDIWMTYGSFRYWCNNCIETSSTPYTIYTEQCCHSVKTRYIAQIPEEVFEQSQVRTYGRCYDHLSTYYAWLFKKIKLKDLVYRGWQYLISGDLAIITPMLEMARTHARAIHDILYLYNKHNPLNCLKQYRGQNLGEQIRSLQPYRAITKPTKACNAFNIGIFKLPCDIDLLINNLATKTYTHILLATEKMRDQIPSNLDEWVAQLEITGSYAAYPLINAKMLNHIDNLGPVVPFHKKFAAWQYAFNKQLTDIAKNTAMILLRTQDYLTLSQKMYKANNILKTITHAACTKFSTPYSHHKSIWYRQQAEYEKRLAIFDSQSQ